VVFVVLLHGAVWWTRLIPGRCVVVLSDFFSFTSFWQRTLIWSQLIFYGNFINSRARDRLIEYFIRVEGKCTGCKSEDRLFGKAVDPVNCHPSQSLGLNELHHYLRKRILQDESFLCACPPPSKKEFLDTLMEVYSGPGCNVIDGILTCYFPVHNPLLDATSHQCWKYIWTWSWLSTVQVKRLSLTQVLRWHLIWMGVQTRQVNHSDDHFYVCVCVQLGTLS
jgi:hypothetical protein